MNIQLTGAPCCWGVDDVKNPHLPPWRRVLDEAARAGYAAIELGPYGYLPIDRLDVVSDALRANGISVVAGTIFDDLVSPANLDSLLRQTDDICRTITALPPLPQFPRQRFRAPYLTVMDWGHDERDFAAGHSDQAPRLSDEAWNAMASHIRAIGERAAGWGVRAVIHPHAGGYIEFADEIDRIAADVPDTVAGLCLDTGHLAYSGMDPVEWLRKYAARLDYVHFKDIDGAVVADVMQRRIRFFEACGLGAMCPIGRGTLDYPAIFRLLTEELRYEGYITIEQERDPRNADGSLEDVRASLQYLKGIGF